MEPLTEPRVPDQPRRIRYWIVDVDLSAGRSTVGWVGLYDPPVVGRVIPLGAGRGTITHVVGGPHDELPESDG
jgi:hypothetical protein